MLDPIAMGRDEANALTEMWAESKRRHSEKLRRENRARRYGYHCHLEELHAALSEEHRAKAQAFLEEPTGGGGGR